MGDSTQEKKEKRRALFISIGSHILLIAIFVMVAAWTEPDPPIPDYGIELAFIGQTVSNNNIIKNTSPAPEENVLEETVPEETNTEELTPEEPINEVDEQTESISEAPIENLTEDVNSPDVVNETAIVEPNISESEDSKPIESTNTSEEQVQTDVPDETVIEPVQEPTTEPIVDERAIFQNNSDQGSEESGSESAASGPSLNMSGWLWDFKPEPDDKSTENGKIVFQITVDDEGEIIGITTLEKTVSPVVEKVYKNAVMELTFSKTVNNKSVAINSKGIITFIIQSK